MIQSRFRAKTRDVLSCVAALVLALATLSGVAFSQAITGTLTGAVTDPSDASVPAAAVTVKDLSSGQIHKTITDERGLFTVGNLNNGFFEVTVEKTGFATVKIPSVQVFVSQLSRVNAKMEIAKTGDQIVVEAGVAVVQTDTVELKNSVDREQILNIPLPTRNPLDLVKSFSGIVSPATGGLGDAFVHGLRGNATNLTQDGINVADNTVKTSAFYASTGPNVDAIGEFSVSVGGVGADGGFGAAQVAMVTQRGTNSYHGSAFWFQRTNALNANTWFNNQAGIARPFQLQQRIGGNGGGPVWIPKIYNGRNRTFIFGAYEAYREPLSRGRERTVLTDSARAGMFTYTPTTGGAPVTVNLLNIGTIGTTGVKPVVNAAVMNFYNTYVPHTGLTDAGCGSGDTLNIRCYAFNLAGKNVNDRYTLRVDHQLTQNHNLTFTYNQTNSDSTPDLLNAIEPQFPTSPTGGQGGVRYLMVGALQSIFGTNKTNEVRIGRLWGPVDFRYPNQFTDTGGTQVSTVAGVLTNPVYTSTNLPQGRETPVFQVIDNFAMTSGAHSFKAGAEYRRITAYNYFYNAVIPITSLGNNSANPDGLSTSVLPGISAGDLSRAQTVFDYVTGLLGNVQQGFNHTSPTSGFVKGVPRVTNPAQNNFAWYFQDSYKVRPNLTVQYGVRWEYQGVFDDTTGLVLLPANQLQGVWGPTPIGQYFTTQTNGAQDVTLTLQGGKSGRPVYHQDMNNFAPFLGIAYDPFKNGKTSIRASFRSFYTQDGFTNFSPISTTNAGLFTTATNSVPTGVFSTSNLQTPATPADALPASQKLNFANNNGQSILGIDPHLATPYVLEWNLGVQRQLFNRTALEVRYVGNHSVKQYRTWNVNELNLNSNGLLTEFQDAQKNLAISQAAGKGNNFSNQGLPGQVNTPIFDKIFAGIPAASGYASSTFATNLAQNTIGTMFDTIRRSPTYRTNITNSFPLNYFVANPWANSALVIDNSGWSYYDGLEMEINRRMANGFVIQGTYTLSKVLTDTTFLNSQNEGQNYLSVLNRRLDKFRAGFDTTHSVAANFLYPLPVGKGKKFLGNAPRLADALVGGWSINGFSRWTTGAPLTISTGRATTGSLIAATPVLRNMTQQQLQQYVGTFRTGNGVYWLDPKSGLVTINANGSSSAVICTAGQTTPCFDYPQAGQYGNIQYNGLSGPHFFGQDLSLSKKTRILEKATLEMRIEMFNVFNTANFTSPSLTTTSSTFGQLTATLDTTRSGGVLSRTGQWSVRITY